MEPTAAPNTFGSAKADAGTRTATRAEYAPSWFGPVELSPPSSRGDLPDDTTARLWRSFTVARALVGLVLVASQLIMGVRGTPADLTSLVVCIAYAAAALLFMWLATPRAIQRLDSQWWPSVGVDLVTFGALQWLQDGVLNLGALMVLPVLTAAILGSQTLALGTAAAAALFQLSDAWLLSQQLKALQTDRLLQAALTGAGYLLLATLVHQLATRLGREEQRALRSLMAAKQQGQVNALVIETLAEGVLVIDPRGRGRAANPAALRLLGASLWPPMGGWSLTDDPAWRPLLDLARSSLASGRAESAEVALERPGRPVTRLQVRTRLTGQSGADADETLCVLFMQDLRDMEARLQTERLAVMGRMSAAVAHEIRNPLAAISQANALLEEEIHQPQQRRLTRMVAQNAQRLSAIVDDILQVTRVQQAVPASREPRLPLDETVRTVATEWAEQNRAAQRLSLDIGAQDMDVAFDADHLRRVLVNLLDNALRYASPLRDAIVVRTRRLDATHAHLAVWSDGAPIAPATRERLFEPFASSESRSSGLGLYICRELCERHAAQIGYRLSLVRERSGNEFHIELLARIRSRGPVTTV